MTSRNPFQKHLEEQELKRRQEEEATAQVYADFVNSFGASSSAEQDKNRRGDLSQFFSAPPPAASKPKMFIRGGIFDPSKAKDQSTEQETQHKPNETYALGRKTTTPQQQTNETTKQQQEEIQSIGIFEGLHTGNDPIEQQKDDDSKPKRKTLEEIRLEIEQRIGAPKATATSTTQGNSKSQHTSSSSNENQTVSTNLFVGNLNPSVTEELLLQTFSKFGPIASVKIMWPRSQEEHARGRNTGFVAFMNVIDAEKAYKEFRGLNLLGNEIRLEWSKPIQIPPFPLIAVGDETLGYKIRVLNCWPLNSTTSTTETLTTTRKQEKPSIFVTLPTDSLQKSIIDRFAHAVVSGGHQVEQIVIGKELGNPNFAFLTNENCSENLYYRWKVFSLLQGDTDYQWRTTPFQMYLDGPLWMPPPIPQRDEDEANDNENENDENKQRKITKKRQLLPQSQRLTHEEVEILKDMLHGLTISNSKICQIMGFALDHSESSADVVEIISNSFVNSALSSSTTSNIGIIQSLIAKLFLVSDILHNSSAAVHNAFSFRSYFKETLPEIFKELSNAYHSITGRITSLNLKEQIIRVLRVWEKWSLYPTQFLSSLEETFLNSEKQQQQNNSPSSSSSSSSSSSPFEPERNDEEQPSTKKQKTEEETIPNTTATTTSSSSTITKSNSDYDIDGIPLQNPDDYDIDGIPMQDTTIDIQTKPKKKSGNWAVIEPSS